METYSIDQLYKNFLPSLQKLEGDRISLSKKLDKLKKFCILGGAIIIVISFPWLGIMSPILFGAMGIGAYTVLYHRLKKDYRQDYKDKIFKELVEELGHQYTYNLNGEILDKTIVDSGLFHEFNKKQSEDLITGNLDDHSFQMVEMQLFKMTKSKSADRGGGMHFIFKGIFFVGIIPLKFPTKIWILSKNHPETYGESRIKDHWQKVELKHLAFRKEYQVYAERKEIAYQILQESILDMILKIRDEIVEEKMRLELSFQERQVFLSVSTRKQLFEPPIKTPVTDLEDFKANFKYLVNTTGLLHKLTLVNH